jgi:hypothetical protein
MGIFAPALTLVAPLMSSPAVCERKYGMPVIKRLSRGLDAGGYALGAFVEKPSHLSSEYGCLVHKTDWIVERVFRIE